MSENLEFEDISEVIADLSWRYGFRLTKDTETAPKIFKSDQKMLLKIFFTNSNPLFSQSPFHFTLKISKSQRARANHIKV